MVGFDVDAGVSRSVLIAGSDVALASSAEQVGSCFVFRERAELSGSAAGVFRAFRGSFFDEDPWVFGFLKLGTE